MLSFASVLKDIKISGDFLTIPEKVKYLATPSTELGEDDLEI